MLRLEPRAGGNSFKLARCFATAPCAGTIKNIRCAYLSADSRRRGREEGAPSPLRSARASLTPKFGPASPSILQQDEEDEDDKDGEEEGGAEAEDAA